MLTPSLRGSVTPAVASGEVRVSLVDQATSAWYVNRIAAVVTAQSLYSTSFSITVPAGTYKAAVYWKPAGSPTRVLTKKIASFLVTP